MRVEKTPFVNLLIINHNVFSDNRGDFKEVFRLNEVEDLLNYKINFCQENNVKSKYMVLRGLHYQEEPFSQSKLVSVIKGEILDVAVDIRKNSPTYGKYFSYKLSENSRKSLFIPKGFAHGYLTLTKYAYVNYKVDSYYNKNSERGIKYNDKYLNIDWGIDKDFLVISEKDNNIKDFIW